VSPTTVSHALNGLGRVDPRTRERVRAVAAELGYRPSLRAQRLRRGESRTIGLLSSMPYAVAGGPSRLGFYMEVAAAAAETALGRGFALVLVPPVESGAPLDSLDIDGAIVVEPVAGDPVTQRLRERGVMVVTIGRQPGADVPHVDLHGAAVGELLLGHLYQQGARRIALVVGEAERHSYLDVRGAYQRFVAERGMPAVVLSAPEVGGEDAGYACCRELLARHPEVDGICATVDAFAVGVLRALAEAGRGVPDEVLVVTRYDGVRSRTSEPPLTSVDLHLGEVAALAVELLLEHLAGESARMVVSGPRPELVIRRSSVRGVVLTP
jgi:DNA-binding LacI/PurR family transcriptional regulator